MQEHEEEAQGSPEGRGGAGGAVQTCSSRRRKEEERGGSRLGGSSSSLSQILASWKITTGGSRYTRFKIHI